MSIFELFVIIIVIGVVVWLIRKYVPLDPPFQTAILVVGVAVVVFLILSAFGLLDVLSTPVPRAG